MNFYILLFLSGFFASMIVLTIFQIVNGQTVKDGIYEDQVIICVNGHVVEQSGNICHLYDTDDLDWYQDSNDGSFFDLKDSFDMAQVD